MGCVHPKTAESDGGDGAERESLLPANDYQDPGDGEYHIQPLPPSPTSDNPPPPLPTGIQAEGGRTGPINHSARRTRQGIRPQAAHSNPVGGLTPNGSRQWADPRLGESGAAQPASLPSETKLLEFTDTLPGHPSSPSSLPGRSPGTGQNEPDLPPGEESILTVRGREVFAHIKSAYAWRDRFGQPTQDFLALMDRLYMDCQLHLTALSSRGDLGSRREADALVGEMITLRNHWGPQLLPNSVCNAFVRERIPLTLGTNQRQFRIDCAQFFEAVPFYGAQQNNPGELMKLYRFSVYDVTKNEVVLRYYLERSNVIQLYHVLCFTCENFRGQVHPYGSEVPPYWEVRQHMLEDVYSRLLSALSRGVHPAPQAHASTIFPTDQNSPVIIQVGSPPVQASRKQ